MSTVQYTIRGISLDLDRVIKKRAKREGKSFNKTVVTILEEQVFGSQSAQSAHEILKSLHGAGKDLLGPEFDQAIREQSQPDKKLWQ